MPTNLPPDYFAVEKRYRAAETTEEKIALLEELMGTIPKHKGTDHLRADLRRRLAKLKGMAQTKKSSGRRDSTFQIDREGAGQVAVVGMPNVGKSALVAALTTASPEVGDFPFTTWTPTPGMMPYQNIQIQLIDTPPLNPEFVEPLLMQLIRRADLVLLVIDLQSNPVEQLEASISLLDEHHIVPDQRKGLVAEEQRLTYIPFLILANKTDDESWDEDWEILKELSGEEWTMLPVSATTGRNLERLKEMVYEQLGIMRVYSKPPGKDPDLDQPFVLKKGSTVEQLAGKVHRDFLEKLKAARVWGSAAHDGLMVGRDHVLQDGDIIELRI